MRSQNSKNQNKKMCRAISNYFIYIFVAFITQYFFIFSALLQIKIFNIFIYALKKFIYFRSFLSLSLSLLLFFVVCKFSSTFT